MITPEFITNNWALTNVSFGETFQSYPTRKLVRIHAREGEFVAKIENTPPSEQKMLRTYEIYDFLSAQNFSPIPSLMKSLDGNCQLFGTHQSIAVMEFIDGGHPEHTILTWHSLGQIAAKLNAMTNFPYVYRIPTEGVIRELTEHAYDHPSTTQFLEYISLLLPLLNHSRQGLIHGEINLSNVMRRQNGELVIIDWDECGTGSTLLEVGYPLLTVFLTEDLDLHKDLAVAFYSGYYSHKQPGDNEKELVFRSALLHALRYMKFANQKQRWERICYAVDHKEHLLSTIFDWSDHDNDCTVSLSQKIQK